MADDQHNSALLEHVEDRLLGDALKERYLAYALSTITSRSLPDSRDGLKPVHRRLLYAMRELKLNPASGYKKCARIVGDVMGKYHPHGDQAIYDSMVRLAQDFAVRFPLVDGQGNFGNIDGDNPAAMRYTEARLTWLAEALLRDIDADTVDFRATYDGEGAEPVVLPAAFPNLLANGASGIAVGMATNIPPHNLVELCDASIHLIRHPNCSLETLLEKMPGHDFPTGGILAESPATILAAYREGKGSLRVRARYQVESFKGGGYQIVINEIPYQVAKSRLVERLAVLAQSKENPLLEDVRDESAEDLRLVLLPRSRNVDPDILMQSLYRQSELETRFPLNMNMLTIQGRTPARLDLKGALLEWTNHRQDILQRRTANRLAAIARRLHLLEGYLVTFLNLDEVIAIIRNEDHPKQELMKRFTLSDEQAEAVLNLRLRALRKLEEMEIRAEHDKLLAEQKQLQTLADDEDLRWKQIIADIQELKKELSKHPDLATRRTSIETPTAQADMPAAALIEKEPITLVISANGWIRAAKGHLSPDQQNKISFKDGDEGRFFVPCQTTDKILLMGSDGRCYTLGADKLPGMRGAGEPVRLLTGLANEHDIIAVLIYEKGTDIVLACSDGRGFRISQDDMVAQTKNGRQLLSLPAGTRAALAQPLNADDDMIAVIGTNRKMLVFPLDQLPKMARGRGVALQRYKGAEISDVKGFNNEAGLSWQIGERQRTETVLTPWLGQRGQAGRMPPVNFPRNNRFSAN